MEIDYFQLNRAEYFVPIMVKIPGRELALAKKFGVQHTLIDFVCEIKDMAGGFTVSNVRDNVDIKLTDATAQQLAKVPVEYERRIHIAAGEILDQISSEGRRDGKDRDLSIGIHNSQSEQRDTTCTDQFGGVEQPTREHSRCAVQRDSREETN